MHKTKRIAINGYGRIGRAVLRAIEERSLQHELQVVAINDLGIAESVVYETRYDSVHGAFPALVEATDRGMRVVSDHATTSIDLLQVSDATALPWGDLDVDLVMECSGNMSERKLAQQHLTSGAGKVLIGAAAGTDVDLTVVYGINHELIKPSHRIVSNASCTTNCLAPVLKPLNDSIGIEDGLMTTIHAYTNGQVLTDTVIDKTDLRRGRSATQSMIPTSTHATEALGWVLPELADKITGISMRVPTINVSVVDLVFRPSRDVTIAEVNQIMADAVAKDNHDVLGYNQQPLVSIDFNHCSKSATFDATQTMKMGRLIKILAWYDNEWGYANRMIDVALTMLHTDELIAQENL
ncbi:type I glyceraldehyde-3-phosphate dehydrogenase [Candidatus Njordibacter sp. Uisw_056]|jgi:glyceraldehyde 3-phosphate dehydrogenase|uniref:type I glyceraldehyde-3-phosphate dehydrogenase n=1 Tax=Candidatus Njordibacter sp. Uisw_056 TaxID=3230973 RepID=UPI003D4FE050|tara:strand:- start:5761 stop:6819 length:1059 start_codon:yes stop_codon:yes gene_type:complete